MAYPCTVKLKYKKPREKGGGVGNPTLSFNVQGKTESAVMAELKKRFGQDAEIIILDLKWR